MKRNEMQRGQATGNSKGSLHEAQALNDLRLRILRAKGGFLSLGTESYMPFIDAQATKEGRALSAEEKLEIRQVINGRVYPSVEHWVELIERALEAQSAA
jgi:hypothetical protein